MLAPGSPARACPQPRAPWWILSACATAAIGLAVLLAPPSPPPAPALPPAGRPAGDPPAPGFLPPGVLSPGLPALDLAAPPPARRQRRDTRCACHRDGPRGQSGPADRTACRQPRSGPTACS